MPQFTVEVSWLDLFKLCLWWLTMAMSFHIGRSRGYPKVPAGPAESKVQVPEVKEKFPQVFMAKIRQGPARPKLLHIFGTAGATCHGLVLPLHELLCEELQDCLSSGGRPDGFASAAMRAGGEAAALTNLYHILWCTSFHTAV